MLFVAIVEKKFKTLESEKTLESNIGKYHI